MTVVTNDLAATTVTLQTHHCTPVCSLHSAEWITQALLHPWVQEHYTQRVYSRRASQHTEDEKTYGCCTRVNFKSIAAALEVAAS